MILQNSLTYIANYLGADLICAETVMNPMQQVDDDKAQTAVDEIKWLFTLR